MKERKQRSDFKGNVRIHIRIPEKQVDWLNSQGERKRSKTVEELIRKEMVKSNE